MFKKISIVVLLCFPFVSHANFECTGAVSGVTLSPQGAVVVASLKDWSYQTICNVSNQSNGVNPEACKAIYSLLLTAQTTNKTVTFWFNAGDCTAGSQPSWTALANWYLGPKIND